MADIQSGTPFKTLVTQTTAVLLTRGFEVEPVAVSDVVSYVVSTAAKNVGMALEPPYGVVQFLNFIGIGRPDPLGHPVP